MTDDFTRAALSAAFLHVEEDALVTKQQVADVIEQLAVGLAAAGHRIVVDASQMKWVVMPPSGQLVIWSTDEPVLVLAKDPTKPDERLCPASGASVTRADVAMATSDGHAFRFTCPKCGRTVGRTGSVIARHHHLQEKRP